MPATVLSKIAIAAKLTELILACVCIALFEATGKFPYELLLPITFGGFIIICPVILLGAFRDCRVPRLLDMIWSFAGMTLFVAAGALTLNVYIKLRHNVPVFHSMQSKGFAMGSLAIINGGTFLVDLLVTYKDVSEYSPH